MISPVINFLHISDSHLGPSENYKFRGFEPYSIFKRLLDAVSQLPVTPDFIIHTGDVCGDVEAHACEDSYLLAKSLCERLKSPLFTLPGNHDETALLKKFFPLPEVNWLDGSENRMSYSFSIGEEHFVVLDGWIKGKRQGTLPENQFEALDKILQEEKYVTIFMHYPPVPVYCDWIDETMLLKNGQVLHSLLCKYRKQIRAVFFGHIHQPLQMHYDGILYVSAAASIFQFSPYLNAADAEIDDSGVFGFNFVTIADRGIRINTRSIRG